MMILMKRVLGSVAVILLIGAAASPVWAHKGKLPSDALTLVRQAAALLAQNPGMRGEVRERLQAALRSKQTQGVHMDQVDEALRALGRNDVSTTRRLLTESIMPAGRVMPPSGPGRSATPLTLASPLPPPAPSGQMPPAGMAKPAPMPTVATVMEMAEPLRPRFGGSAAEIVLFLVGALFAGSGLLTVIRGREVEG